ncbi:MAG: hypothetical protein HFF62_15745 [Oscillospiraceae bacterium]|nr:hypothetical protein [Oscillospiraceae bacterium]
MGPDGEFTFGVYIISVGRAKRGPITAKHFLEYTHVVRKSQEQEYIDNGFQNVWGIEDELINGYDKVFNYLVDYAKDDVIAIVDDDIAQFLYREKDTVPIESPETVQAEFERIAQMLVDLRLGLAFGPPTAVPYNYTSEWSWTGMPGAFKLINRACIKARMDPKIWRNIDVDYVLQETLHNRICLDAKWLCCKDYVDKETHTSGSLYTYDDVQASLEVMKLRWGRYFDYSRNIVKIMVTR